ncbi:MAG: GyrI-like domain-containing protein [Candidatus Pelethousia sp.]|nr:GyrI-like domain-containing protein [Candidatus Pelethousia sp.]
MPRASDIAVLKLPAQSTLCVRKATRVEALPMLIGQSYGKIAAYLQASGEAMADVPFVAYHNMDMRNLDVEIGFPVSIPLAGREDIIPGTIPAGKAVFCIYRGAYSEMLPVYTEMAQWIEDNGYAPTGISYEYYYNGPDWPQQELLTKIVIPVETCKVR